MRTDRRTKTRLLDSALKSVQKDIAKAGVYRCQFCGYFGKGWKSGGYSCPRCGKHYDWVAAQDSEE